MRNRAYFIAAFLALVLIAAGSFAADNELTPEEKAAGWRLLFNGKDYADWQTNTGKPPAAPIEDGCMVPYKGGGYLLVHKDQFGDFVLKCDVKMPPACNSGIFFRIGDLKNPVQTGFEVQIATGKGTSSHDFGAVYDMAKITKNAAKPAGEWNAVTISAKGPNIEVEVNGEKVCSMNCDDYTVAGRNPDGSKNKFKKAVKDFPRKGYIGFQDHGTKVWYKNIRILELTDGGKKE
ncbi:MAG: DUF1080 domain-containing protein [Candidatus Sumerlaeia bacterium]|nr:DUF1080 domain-containing protein [Candidatus Sumerlaeia bacterium]